jgi:hypothetical protein
MSEHSSSEPVTDTYLDEGMLWAMRECWSYRPGGPSGKSAVAYGYRFRQATMRKLTAMGLARTRTPGDIRKRPAWELTEAGESIVKKSP